MRLLLGLLLVAGAGLGARIVELSVFKHDRFAVRAAEQSQDIVEIPGPRGDIVDRSGRVLAISVPTKILIVEPVEISRQGLGAIERAAGQPRGSLTRRADSKWRVVDRDCGPKCESAVLNLIADGRVPRDAVHFNPSFQRAYPHGSRAAHVLGFVTDDEKVREGIENSLGHLLASSGTRLMLVKDVSGQTVSAREIDSVTSGPSSVMLTIDLRIQATLEDELARAAKRHRASGAQGIVLDPRNGDVLAMAVWPAFDPARFGRYSAGRLRNSVVEHAFEPGSVFKPLVAAVLLQSRAVDPREIVYCENGSWRAGARVIRDFHPHGYLTLPRILEVSSNIGMAKLTQRLPPATLHDSLARFGLGRSTGLGLPGESPGLFRAPDDWDGGDQESIGFGHAVAVTPLQLAAAYGALANGGVRTAPRIVRAWGSPDGTWHTPPEAVRERVLDEVAARRVAGWLTSVVEGDEGTGSLAAVPGFAIAGKTGTAEKIVGGRYDRTLNLATFAGFGPMPEPTAVVVVTIDGPTANGRTAGLTAAPVFSKVMSETLRLARVAPPSYPDALPSAPLRIARGDDGRATR